MLGKEFEMTGDLIKELEEYVFRLYGDESSDVNALRYEIFWKTLKKQETSHWHISSTTLSIIFKITC